jgi:hypothetical protein
MVPPSPPTGCRQGGDIGVSQAARPPSSPAEARLQLRLETIYQDPDLGQQVAPLRVHCPNRLRVGFGILQQRDEPAVLRT